MGKKNTILIPLGKLKRVLLIALLIGFACEDKEQDTIPPEIVYIFPAPSQSYTSGEIYSLECILKDNLSGIEPSEEALKIILNGKKIFCAYQPVKNELSYSLVEPLISGDYSMYISARDYAGNKMEKTIIFNVN